MICFYNSSFNNGDTMFIQLPTEIIDIIADFHDYEKYCKPNHKEMLLNVLNDIKEMDEFMEPISANIAWQCWGIGGIHIPPESDIPWEEEEELWFE